MIKNIIKGWWYKLTNRNLNLKASRLKICDACEYKKQLTKHVFICALCGCVLDAKARVKDEHCELNKW